MSRAAVHFCGRHDFAAFARSGHQAPSTIVVVEDCKAFELGDLVLLRIIASHFLWGQVRRMVGALTAVGRGLAEPDDLPRWLAGTAPPPEPAAPSSGLFLEAVRYRGEPRELPPPVPVGLPWTVPARNRGGNAGEPGETQAPARRPRSDHGRRPR
jgi:tRNA pseudouridine38-40 synthase